MGVSAFRDFMPHTVIIEAWSSQDSYGQPTYSTCSSYPARVEMKSRRIAGSGGVEIAARGRVFLATRPSPAGQSGVARWTQNFG